ncbi:MAG TPA: cytochrome c peroxidase, partial [Labilithrix sp.]|nr:cytochrome c peroxidase [Labilithrix sp.]
AAAFPGDAEPITVANVVRAIATFERAIVSARSPYDRWSYGEDDAALSESARRGMDLFFSERLECFHCHGGFNFTDSVAHDGQPLPESGFHNNALYDVDGRGGYPETNRGLFDQTGEPRDMGRFRAPSLRNIALTAPYMHDGSIATLWDVMDHYNKGGEPNAFLDGGIEPLALSETEINQLVSFMFTLTDDRFAQDNKAELERQKKLSTTRRPLRDDAAANRKVLPFERRMTGQNGQR